MHQMAQISVWTLLPSRRLFRAMPTLEAYLANLGKCYSDILTVNINLLRSKQTPLPNGMHHSRVCASEHYSGLRGPGLDDAFARVTLSTNKALASRYSSSPTDYLESGNSPFPATHPQPFQVEQCPAQQPLPLSNPTGIFRTPRPGVSI